MPQNGSTTSIDAAQLATFVPLSGLKPAYLNELAQITAVVEVDAGHELIGDDRTPGLTWYLLAGELVLRARDADEGAMIAGTPEARFAIPGAAQGHTSIRARTASRLVGVDRPQVSTMLILAQTPRASAGADAWAVRLLRSDLFARVPPANVQRMFDLMETVSFEAGETIVEQGSTGEFYYVIRDGAYEVSHSPGPDLPPVTIAELGPGETFGEEALVSGTARNATVRAIRAGRLMRMTKGAFAELIQDPLLDTVDRTRAEDLVRLGARWIDTRLPEEHENNGIEGSLSIPLAEIPDRARELDSESAYVVYCNSGRRSAAAAFLLTQLGYHASVLAGGLNEQAMSGEHARPSIEAQGLRAEILEASQDLEDALRQKAQVEAVRRVEPAPASGASEEAQAALLERQRQLEEGSLRATEALATARRRKLELEERLRATEARAVSLRSRAQEQIAQLRAEAEERLRAEEARLQTQYTQAAQEMKRIESARAQAEAHFHAERERLEAELAEARARMEREAERIRNEMEAAKRGATDRAAAIQSQHANAETRLRDQTEARLREERRRLESEFASSVEAQEKARQELHSAESAIALAEQESQRLAARIAAEREAREAAERARQEAERQQLERERERAAAELEAAENEKRKAEKYLASTREKAAAEKSTEKVASVEAKVAEASQAVESARAAKAEADEARERAEVRIAAQRELEEEIRLQLIQEAESWLLDERERSESELEKAHGEADQLEEIEARKAASKRRDQAADMSLLADVSAQLGDQPADELDIIEKSLQQREFAAEKAALAKRAQEDATAERMRAEQALEEARRKLASKSD